MILAHYTDDFNCSCATIFKAIIMLVLHAFDSILPYTAIKACKHNSDMFISLHIALYTDPTYADNLKCGEHEQHGGPSLLGRLSLWSLLPPYWNHSLQEVDGLCYHLGHVHTLHAEGRTKWNANRGWDRCDTLLSNLRPPSTPL